MAQPAPAPGQSGLRGEQREGGPCLAELGEWELIRRLARFAPQGQFEDDAALLAAPPAGQALVVNTDVLVEGVHFSDSTTGPADVGWRAVAANLSDLAAMGCPAALGITVGLVAPGVTSWSWVEGVYEGIAAALERYGGTLLGGDCSSGSQRLLAITALGALEAGRPIRRGDGQPGDRLVSSGSHGLSRLGLALLQGELADGLAAALPPALVQRSLTAHRRPRPRFDVVQALEPCRPPDLSWRVGGCDSSDGLVAAAAAIAKASGCAALLERSRLPLEPAMADLPEGERWCLAGGEDFELVLALAPDWADALCRTLPDSRPIGELVATGDQRPAGSVHWQSASGALRRGAPDHGAREGKGLVDEALKDEALEDVALETGLGGYRHFG